MPNQSKGSIYLGFHVPEKHPYNGWDKDKRQIVKDKVTAAINGNTTIHRREDWANTPITTQEGGSMPESDVVKVLQAEMKRTRKGEDGFASDSHALSLAPPPGGASAAGGEPEPDHITYVFMGTRRVCIHGYGLEIKDNDDDGAAPKAWEVEHDGETFQINANLHWGAQAEANSGFIVGDPAPLSSDQPG